MGVRLYHPDKDMTITVRSASEHIHRAKGWIDPPGETPNHSAKKAEWVEFAAGQGLDREEAEGLTKDELIERYG